MSAFAYIILLIVAVLACAIGAVGAYFYYRARHREAVADLEALDQDLAEREEELHRLQYQFRNTYPGGSSNVQTEPEAEIHKLRDELEQKSNDYNILKQDFDLEIGILKQELEQLRKEKSSVEHAQRHIARKEAELEERESVLVKQEQSVADRTAHLESEIAARQAQLEEELAARARTMESELVERDRQLLARRSEAEKEREDLAQAHQDLREKQVQFDAELMELPNDRFTSRQEALLIKRLRQQIKLQRDELERLQRLYHKAAVELRAFAGNEPQSAEPAPEGARDVIDQKDATEEVRRPDDEGSFAREQGDSFPAYSTLSSFVDRRAETASGSVAYASDSGHAADVPQNKADGSYDDLLALPGITPRLQEQLLQLGITSFDQIARWSSADVRRISEQLEIDRKTIQDHWIINAQSHLFARKTE